MSLENFLIPVDIENKLDFDRILLFEDSKDIRDQFDLVFRNKVKHFYYDFSMSDFLSSENGLLNNSLIISDMNLTYNLGSNADINIDDMWNWVNELNVEYPCPNQGTLSSCCEHPSSKLSCGIYRSLIQRDFPVQTHFLFISANTSKNDLLMMKKNSVYLLKKRHLLPKLFQIDAGTYPTLHFYDEAA